jgi:hypothetical protein
MVFPSPEHAPNPTSSGAHIKRALATLKCPTTVSRKKAGN